MLSLLMWFSAYSAASSQPYEMRKDLLRLLGLFYFGVQSLCLVSGLGISIIPGVIILPAAAKTYLE